MMTSIAQRRHFILNQLANAHHASPLASPHAQLLAVSKRQSIARIEEALNTRQRHFAENQVQEAQHRWQEARKRFPDLQLHLIGPLQSNKTKEAVALFDVIHTIDREKIARAIKDECAKQDKRIPCLIQINIGQEPQKAGIAPKELPSFLTLCRDEIGLPITGLMAIPPAGGNPAPYFALMKKLADQHQLPELSMGMSSDYEAALRFGATYIRVGTALFGQRED